MYVDSIERGQGLAQWEREAPGNRGLQFIVIV